MLHAIPNMINGIDKIPIIPNIVYREDSETFGLFISHGSGKDITNQITESNIIIFVFLLICNN